MLSRLFLLLSVCVCALNISYLQAQEAASSTAEIQGTGNVETEMPEADVPDTTSKAARENKKFGLLIGSGRETTASALHAAIDVYLNPDLILQLKGVSDSEDVYDGVKDSENSVNLGLKIFQGNSFYIKPSVGYLKYSEVDTISFIIGQVLQVTTDANQLSAVTGSLAIGNQWQWKNLSIGVEWVGVTHTLATLDYENDPKKTFLTALQLSFGANF